MELHREIRHILVSYWYYVALILLSSLIIIASTSAVPYFIGEAFRLIRDGGTGYGSSALGLLALAYVLRSAFKLIRNHFSAVLGTGMVLDIREHATGRYLRSRKGNSRHTHSSVYSLLTYDLESISAIISSRSFVFIEDVLILGVSLIQMCRLSVTVFLSTLPFLAALFIISFRYSKTLEGIVKELRNTISGLSEAVEESMLGQKEFRALNARPVSIRRFQRHNASNMEFNRHLNATSRSFVPLVELLSYFCMLLSMLLSGYLSIQEQLDISAVVLFYGYMVLLVGVTSSLSGMLMFYVNSKQSIKRIAASFQDLSQVQPEFIRKEAPGAGPIEYIECRQLSVKGSSGYLLHNINLILKRGQMTAITGGIGAGKSLLAQTLAGLFPGYEGVLQVNGKALSELDHGSYATRVGYVPQEPLFFSGTVRENLLMGRTVGEDTLMQVLKGCCLDSVVAKMEHGLDTQINKDRNFLSGGEKQRMSLARVLISDPDVILIDDGLHALDSVNQTRILDHLIGLATSKIVMIITNSDRVREKSGVVLELIGGKLTEQRAQVT